MFAIACRAGVNLPHELLEQEEGHSQLLCQRMAHFHDLAPCTYFRDETLPPLVAVGWLDEGHEFPTGEVPPGLLPRLIAFRRSAKSPWGCMFLGYHGCYWCSRDAQARKGMSAEAHSLSEYLCWWSKTNLFIPGDGVVYASPEGIIHYIVEHRYRPPAEFIDAVLAAPDIESPEYAVALRACGWPEADLGQWQRREHEQES